MKWLIKWQMSVIQREITKLMPKKQTVKVSKLEYLMLNLVEWLLEHVYYPIRSVYWGICNIIKWAPLIYNDRDWDQYYLLKMLEFKFKNMAECQLESANHIGYERTAKELKLAAEYCRRLNDDSMFGEGIFPTSHKRKSIFGNDLVPSYNKLQYDMMRLRRNNMKVELGKLLARKLDTWWD